MSTQQPTRLVQHPGVVFPKKIMWLYGPQAPQKNPLFEEGSIDALTTAQVAVEMKCSVSGARQLLERKGIKKYRYVTGNSKITVKWNRQEVFQFLEAREQVQDIVPEGVWDIRSTCIYLGVVRSYVYALVQKGLIRSYKSRVRTKKGFRIRSYYFSEDVKQVKGRIGREMDSRCKWCS